MELTLRTRYWANQKAKQEFIRVIKEIHNVDFTEWDRAGFWDDDLVPFSYCDGDRIVATACVYTMPSIVNGEKCKVAQVSSVGTLPEYRLRGLNRKLHEIALEWAFREHRFAFLFSDKEAIPFYQKCGFRPICDFAPVVSMAGTHPGEGIEKLDLRLPETLQALYELACRREPASDVFSNLNPKLVMFHALYSLRDHAYRIPALGTVFFMKKEPGRTIVHDVLATSMPSFDQLYPYLSSGGSEEFEFRFYADKLGIPNAAWKELRGNDTHVMGPTDGLKPFVFPFTAHA